MTVTAANDIGSLYNVSSDAVKNILAGSSDTTQGDNENMFGSILNAAISNLNGSVDKSVLNSLIEEAKALDTAGYTEASIASFEAAIASAQSVLTDAGASQSDVDKQILLLQKAAEALIQRDALDKLQVLEELGWMDASVIENCMDYAIRNQKTQAFIWLLERKTRKYGFHDRSFDL